MKTSVKGMPGAQLLAAIGVVLFSLIVFLLFMSNRTGQEEFDAEQGRLDDVEALNIRLDGALFMSMFELRMDFDLLTDMQRQLRKAIEQFAAVAPRGEAAEVVAAARRKLDLVEDFKSEQAVLRNSRMIVAQTFEKTWSQIDAIPPEDRAQLFDLERAYLDFIGRRDPASGLRLEEQLQAARRRPAFAHLNEWMVLDVHLANLLRYVASMGSIMQQLFVVPMQEVIVEESARIAGRLANVSSSADRYRMSLFAMAVLLLACCALMALKLREYLRMIERANDELEARVAKRTEELAGVNAALMIEIAERESVESQLRVAQKLEAIGQLAAGVAHEINTPTQYVSDNLAFVAGVWQDLAPVFDDYGRCVRGGPFDVDQAGRAWEAADAEFLRTEVPAALQQAREGLAQISNIVLGINTFSHPGGRGLQSADLNKAIENIVAVARNEWKYVAELTLDLDPTLGPVPCDVSGFSQVVLNLVVNAAHAIASMREGDRLGNIQIVTRRLPHVAEIIVEDDGPGVPAEIRDRIFDPFFTTKEVGKGTGQGLAIAHRVIHDQHGGKLLLTDSLAGGARFVIRLPLEIASTVSESVELSSPEAQRA